jgi:hypothetical protein
MKGSSLDNRSGAPPIINTKHIPRSRNIDPESDPVRKNPQQI